MHAVVYPWRVTSRTNIISVWPYVARRADPHKRLAYKATPPQLPIKGTPLVSQRYVVETITMTTVTERRVVREATTDTLTTLNTNANTKSVPAAPSLTETPALANAQPMAPNTKTTAAPDDGHAPISHPGIDRSAYLNSTAAKLPANLSTAAQISGILKGGKLWKSEPSQVIFIDVQTMV